MENNNEILIYKNFFLFYQNLYLNLFGLINHLIDENQFNIVKSKNKLNDFLDNYSYYLMKKQLIEEGEGSYTSEKLIEDLKKFDKFSESLNKYPSKEYNAILFQLKQKNYDLKTLSNDNYIKLLDEYYSFFNDLIQILEHFIDVSSESGFLPIVKNNSALRSIGYANYDLFFKELEHLKAKMSEITININYKNLFKNRRCAYIILVSFSPYFKHKEIFEKLKGDLNFEFINERDTMINLKKSLEYDSLLAMGSGLRTDLNDIVEPLKENIGLIKRYISYEFGERDINPRIKKKYAYDPTDV